MAKVTLKKVREVRLTMNAEELKALYYAINPRQVRDHGNDVEVENLYAIASQIEDDLMNALNKTGVDF